MFVVLHLEKTGGTTIEKSIEPHLELGDLYLKDWQMLRFATDKWLNEHSISDTAYDFLESSWGSFKKFSTVRDPVNIMRSMYNYAKYVYDNTPNEEKRFLPEGAVRAYAYSYKYDLGTDGFVDYMFNNNYTMVSPQTFRLRKMLKDGLIIDIEQLNDRWNDVMSYLGIGSVKSMNRNVLGSSHIIFSDLAIQKIKNHFMADYDTLPSITGMYWN